MGSAEGLAGAERRITSGVDITTCDVEAAARADHPGWDQKADEMSASEFQATRNHLKHNQQATCARKDQRQPRDPVFPALQRAERAGMVKPRLA
jgi:hypothetical protein